MDHAFKYFETKMAMPTSDYKYTGRDGRCEYKESEGVVSTTGYHDNEATDMGLMTGISEHVVSVAIEADKSAF